MRCRVGAIDWLWLFILTPHHPQRMSCPLRVSGRGGRDKRMQQDTGTSDRETPSEKKRILAYLCNEAVYFIPRLGIELLWSSGGAIGD
ncbi:hypothetical protein QBC47DRAFT_386253 [Echria macrotheca]|uniref:Secreted protein n=1 Tax=Echria macrotheca TaxID=438768 RepID=A0AAJ0BAE8_9PEZI|nr:hypothetical protein QBC47DRAFT_386253 [Echria macrotheca]